MRNRGIDLLKISAMLAVVVLHVLKQGGVLGCVSIESINFDVAWLIECTAYSAVNCYAIVSGFVGIGARHKYTSIMLLWVQVAFYTILTLIVFIIVFPDAVTKSAVIRALLPVMNADYWYFTAYFCLFFFMPFLNEGIKKMGKRELAIAVVVIGVLFSARGLFLYEDAFDLDGGYGVLWLIYMYIVGGFIKKHLEMNGKCRFLICFVICTLFNWFGEIGITKYALADSNSFVGQAMSSLVSYTSPTMLISAVCLVVYFSKLSFKAKSIIKIIETLAPISFGVYLIHAEPLIWVNVLSGAFEFLASYHPVKLIGGVILISLSIFAVCIFIDFLRNKLFQLLRIKQHIGKIEDRIIR